MIGVIADDLTGAAELGAVGLRHGLRAEIVRSGGPGGKADLVCVDTDSRSCKPPEAAKRAAAAAKILHASGAEWIYKKVDSVLRGNVTAEVEAVMQQLNFNRALLLPANPSLGRVIRDGEYFVKGRPINRTEFARDPEYPRRTAQVMRLVGAPEFFLLRLANGEMAVPENTMMIGQAESSEGVRQWAGAADRQLLPVGGSEFFNALLAARKDGRTAVTPPGMDFSTGQQLFVCGTASKSVQALLKSARASRVPVFTLPRELVWGARLEPATSEVLARRVAGAFANHRRVILGIGLPQVHDVEIARGLSAKLVEIAELVLRRVAVKSIFAEGGATSAELVRRMNWPRLEVCREWAPGVASLSVAGEHTQWLTIKPGSYAWPEEWTHEP
jgi:uncharacterized protein YgbK (DUF1537 family)